MIEDGIGEVVGDVAEPQSTCWPISVPMASLTTHGKGDGAGAGGCS
jgi:hypothetical protein